ncbi:hypothetical protein Nepgr_003484 [Nepenthes gracilis]|uniref:Uncharacterized protein n=1 Tax=Nepenthes gracilis TaxID=150966 RepID=A0AAD3RZM5_NEPGR|nr:hypothetical protein Nepgr_003484 [Nepenthes gracilis]
MADLNLNKSPSSADSADPSPLSLKFSSSSSDERSTAEARESLAAFQAMSGGFGGGGDSIISDHFQCRIGCTSYLNNGAEKKGLSPMEAGSLSRPGWCIPKLPLRRPLPAFPPLARASLSNSQKAEGYRGLKPRRNLVADWVYSNDDTVRILPTYVGSFSLLAVLLNRAVFGIAQVADAGSAQPRADLLTLGLAVTDILTGLVWLSIRPKSISMVDPQGVECQRVSLYLPDSAASELEWSLVVVYDNNCILQIGMAAESSKCGEAEAVDVAKLIQGSLYQGIMNSGAQSYLGNLSLYPGKSELPFLPANTPAVILQPLGGKGTLIIGGDTVRGFTTTDQETSWMLLCQSWWQKRAEIRGLNLKVHEALPPAYCMSTPSPLKKVTYSRFFR